MEQGDHAGKRKLRAEDASVRYTLEQYRDDRVGENIRRLTDERIAAGAAESYPAAENSRRRAVLRETSMPSAFEYVNYNMPETVPQEVVARRQIARDMVDPGIYSDGPRLTDIVHQPPQHATLSALAAHPRSGRDVLLSRDRAIASDENVAPLPRPYLPRGVIDSYGEPYQHNRRVVGGPILSRHIRTQRPALLQANRNLQDSLRTRIPGRMGRLEVQDAANILQLPYTTPNRRDDIVETLRDLQQNWYPEENTMNETGIGRQVARLVNYPDTMVTSLAQEILEGWRKEIRLITGRRLAPDGVGQDPFVDEAASDYGRTISHETWDREIRKRQKAAQDYNDTASAEIRAARERKWRRDLQKPQARDREDVRLYMQNRDAALAAFQPMIGENITPASTFPGIDTRFSGSERGNHDSGERGNGRGPESTITDPDEDSMPTGNQDFEILEADPSPERSQHSQGNNALQERREEDVPFQSIEVEGPIGPCHECPDFPGTYHHICAPFNTSCVNVPTSQTREWTSPSYGPSQSPQPPRQASQERMRGQTPLAELLRLAAAAGVRPASNVPPNAPGDGINLGRTEAVIS